VAVGETAARPLYSTAGLKISDSFSNPNATTDKLQRLLNAAARLLSGMKKFDRGLSQVMHVNCHWLDVPERGKYKLVTMVYNCLHGKALSYLTDCCTPISDVAFCQSSSATRPSTQSFHIWSSGFFCRGSGSAAWNYLSDELREPLLTANSFRQLLKTRLFAEYYSVYSALEVLHIIILTYFTYLLNQSNTQQTARGIVRDLSFYHVDLPSTVTLLSTGGDRASGECRTLLTRR